ncbi:MAG: hypothetical protein SFZ02_15690 [bacterium]|nr:hypothetical protein [bacterium]
MQLFRNRRDNPNVLVAVVLLFLLVIFAGPSNLPRLLSSVLPFADEGVACERLRDGTNRAYHQSLLGRVVNQLDETPISLTIRTSALNEQSTTISVTVVITNRTVAPVPLLITPGQFILAPEQPVSGLGITLNTTSPVPFTGENATSYQESRIRLLGPRQRCVHRVTYELANRPPALLGLTPESSIKAFYRNTFVGTVAIPNNPAQYVAPPAYNDQGLWVGIIESDVQKIGVDN